MNCECAHIGTPHTALSLVEDYGLCFFRCHKVQVGSSLCFGYMRVALRKDPVRLVYKIGIKGNQLFRASLSLLSDASAANLEARASGLSGLGSCHLCWYH